MSGSHRTGAACETMVLGAEVHGVPDVVIESAR